jgi:hypothetical protein
MPSFLNQDVKTTGRSKLKILPLHFEQNFSENVMSFKLFFFDLQILKFMFRRTKICQFSMLSTVIKIKFNNFRTTLF